MSEVTRGQDSSGNAIYIGSRVRFRGEVYTIAGFTPKEGRAGVNVLTFEEPVLNTAEIPDEFAVDSV